MWAIAVSELAGAAMLTLLIGAGGKTPTAGAGLRMGAVLGFVVSIFMDFNIYGTTNIADMTAVLVDPALGALRFAITGAVIGAVAGRK